MIKIGIVGSQSMHAGAFAKACNIPHAQGTNLIEDCRITAICGMDDTAEHTQKIAKEGRISQIVEKPEELLELCDAVMILTRDGESHVPLGMPFLEKGYPVFLDKPVCVSFEDIERLRRIVQQRDCILAGGSCMPHMRDVKAIKTVIDRGELGMVKGISLNHNGDIEGPYRGIFFYVCHGVETIIRLMGDRVQSVQTAVLDRENFSIYFKYENQFANLILTCGYEDYFINIYGEKKHLSHTLDTSDLFEAGLRDFVHRIRAKVYTRSVDALTAHVRILHAVEESIMQKREVYLV